MIHLIFQQYRVDIKIKIINVDEKTKLYRDRNIDFFFQTKFFRTYTKINVFSKQYFSRSNSNSQKNVSIFVFKRRRLQSNTLFFRVSRHVSKSFLHYSQIF